MEAPWTIDFETEAIRGHIPPVPTSMAAKQPDGTTHFYSWGHPNSPTPEEDEATAKQLFYHLCAVKTPLLCQNAKFDMGVAQYHWGIGPKDPLLVHDTMFLLFLNNPYSTNLSLKPSAELLLNWAPEEQDACTEWIIANTACTKRSEAGAWLSHVPYDIIMPYCAGDVDRTRALFDLLYPRIVDQGMLPAYQREQKLMPLLYESEQRGVRIDREQLEEDLEVYEATLLRVEDDLRTKLLAPELDFSPAATADALDNAGYIGEWMLTPTGKRSTKAANLEKAVNDQNILHLLRYRGAMASVLQTFARPWLQDSAADGRLHTQWNQVRTRGAADQGTRTGRLSASRPNLMNVPNELRIVLPEDYPPPPFMRRYMLPEEGHTWIKRDYSSQEVRMLAHFEGKDMMQEYLANPAFDPHTKAVNETLTSTGTQYQRKQMKDVLFGMIYGQGGKSLAEQLGIDQPTAYKIIDALYAVFPGVKALQKGTSKRGRNGGYITTLGGRRYYAEPSKLIRGRPMDFSYKLLNYLIQGSSADQTKESILHWYEHKLDGDVFLATVHDENNVSAPTEHWQESMAQLRESMDQRVLDVPSASEGFYGPNWFDIVECP